jgi:predicted DNA-binding protein (MmcQ/YjbR family)
MKSTSKATPSLRKLEQAIRVACMSYPETREDFPWGHSAFKVNDKAFVFMGGDADEVSFSVKLPHSRDIAADLPFTEPTGYGMGKYGWVTVKVRKETKVTLDLIKAWIDESYRAIAPKKLVKLLDAAKK